MASSWVVFSWCITWSFVSVVAYAYESDESDESSEQHSDNEKGNPPVLTFLIAAGAICGIILFSGLCGLCCWFIVRRQRSRQNDRPMPVYGSTPARPTAPTEVTITESTFSQQPGTNVVILRNDYEDGNSFRTADGRRESPPPAYETLFSESNNQGDVGYPAKPHSIKK